MYLEPTGKKNIVKPVIFLWLTRKFGEVLYNFSIIATMDDLGYKPIFPAYTKANNNTRRFSFKYNLLLKILFKKICMSL